MTRYAIKQEASALRCSTGDDCECIAYAVTVIGKTTGGLSGKSCSISLLASDCRLR
ncbi:MAG TPA: hypothetical protein PK140_08030 [Polyangiaceae bacterium]|nr:hypothetical protein [Polyangiaceae bacterium]HQM09329.1 hypothetical protein [Polyangiaceae bacterium]